VILLLLIGLSIGFIFSDIQSLTNEQEIIAYIVGRGLAVFIIFVVISVLAFVSSLALGVKRLHDRDKSGWWILLFYIVPEVLNGAVQTTDSQGVVLVGTIASVVIAIWGFIELGCLRGTAGPNRFGPDPLVLPPS
jgi:uncharacterized membrane protein YhaH (DUF805 family)